MAAMGECQAAIGKFWRQRSAEGCCAGGEICVLASNTHRSRLRGPVIRRRLARHYKRLNLCATVKKSEGTYCEREPYDLGHGDDDAWGLEFACCCPILWTTFCLADKVAHAVRRPFIEGARSSENNSTFLFASLGVSNRPSSESPISHGKNLDLFLPLSPKTQRLQASSWPLQT